MRALFYFLHDGVVQWQIKLGVSPVIDSVVALPIKHESGTRDFVVKSIKHFPFPVAMTDGDIKGPNDREEDHIVHINLEPVG